MAGDVATTGGAGAGATHALPSPPEAAAEDTVAPPPAEAGPAELDTRPGERGRRDRRGPGVPVGQRPEPGHQQERGSRARRGVGTRRAPAGPARGDAGRRDQPGARADDQNGARDPPQGRCPADRARLRGGRALAHRAEAQERRPVHHPSARRGHHPGRAGDEPRDAVRGPAARHGGRHRLRPRPAAGRFRGRDRGPGGRGHQAGQGQVRRGRRGRDRAQDGGRDVPGHQGPGHQARRPPAQHAHAALSPPGEAGAQVA